MSALFIGALTQQFNTTSSLGRLTLNILLSFAQFEREIISERTRDKDVGRAAERQIDRLPSGAVCDWKCLALSCLFAKRRFPRLLKFLKVEVNLKKLWRRPRCAQTGAFQVAQPSAPQSELEVGVAFPNWSVPWLSRRTLHLPRESIRGTTK